MSAGNNHWAVALLHLLVIAVVAVLLYSNTFHVPFVFDDSHTITENDAIRNTTMFLRKKSLFRTRNLVYLTLSLTYRLWKLDVFWYHAGNTVSHVLAAWTAYFLALAVFRLLPDGKTDTPRTAALLTALVFVAHPLQTQAVTYCIQRMASMAALFFMLSVLLYLSARSHMKDRADQAAPARVSAAAVIMFLLSALCGILAIMCKENAACLPVVILLAEYVLFDRSWRTWKRKIIWFAVMYCVLAVVSLYMIGGFRNAAEEGLLHEVASATRLSTDVSRLDYLCTQFSVITIYIRLLVLPVGQCLDWLYPFKTGFFDDFTPLAFLFLAAVAAGALLAVRKYPIVTLAAGWFFITLAVESTIIPITDALVEHRLYLPLFGFAVLVPWLIFRLLPTRRRLACLICLILVTALGTGTFLRNKTWCDEETLWSDVIDKCPHNYRAFNNLGRYLALQKRYQEAIIFLERSLALHPSYAEALNNRGYVSLSTGNMEEAIDFTSRALQARPSFGKAHQQMGNILTSMERYEEAFSHYRRAVPYSRNNLGLVRNNMGLVLAAMGRLSKAVKKYRRALKKAPDDPEILTNLGLVLARQGNYDEAVRCYKKALAENSNNALSHNGLGVVLANLRRTEEAEKHYAEAVQIDPGFTEAHNNWGLLLTAQGRTDEAIRQFITAIELDSGYAQAHNNLGVVLAGLERVDEAAEHFSQALQAQPGFADAHNNLGNALTRKKRYDEAIHHYREALKLNPGLETTRKNLDIVIQYRDAHRPSPENNE